VDQNRIIHQIGHAGAMISALKMILSQPEVELCGQKMTYHG
jgi:hypothetical protein